MKKTIGFYVSLLAAVLAAAALAVMFSYRGRGGIVAGAAVIACGAGILLELLSFFGEHFWSDFASIGGAACLAYAVIRVTSDGIWNIAESINGIKMVGLPELAPMNYTIAGIGFAAVLFAVLACFMAMSKAA